MEEWKEYKLEEIGKITTGKTPKTAIKENFGGSIFFVSPSDINTPYKYVSETDRYLTEEGLNSIASNSIEEGSICVSCIGNLGYVGIVKQHCASNQQINSITVNEEHNRDFIYYSIKNLWPFFKSYEGQSTALSILNKGQFSKISIKCPSLNTQTRIASILSSLDDKIECNRRINENLEQQAQALFKSWFVDFEPFKDQPFVESELGMIPQGWRVQEAQQVFNINIGKTPPRKESEWFSESNEDNVWVSIADMGSCGAFISDSSEYLTDEAVRRFNVQMVEKDSILLSFKLTVGRVAIADTRLTTNEAIARFILPKKFYREFLYLYLKQYKYGNLGSTSSIATAVNSKTIKGMRLLIPNVELIESFSKNTRPLFEQIRTIQQESRRLAELRDTLLPRLMSGELKVNDLENNEI